MFKKYFLALIIITLLSTGFLWGRDIVNILQTDKTYTLHYWGSPQFLVKDSPMDFKQIKPDEDFHWGGGFGYIAEKKNIGPFFQYPENSRLKSGDTERRHPILDFNIPLQSAFSFGLKDPGRTPSAILYMKHKEPFTWNDIKEHLTEIGLENVYVSGVVTSRDMWGHYLGEDYPELLKTTNKTHFHSFYKERATIKLQGYFLNNRNALNISDNMSDFFSLPDCLIFETSVYITDVPLLNTNEQMIDFFNDLKPVQMGFTPEFPQDWELLRGILFVYELDELKSNH